MDTNILVLAAGSKPDDLHKSRIARDLILSEVFGVSAQSIAEFVNCASRAVVKLRDEEVDRWIDFLSSMPFTPLDTAVVRRGYWLSRRYRIQYYDAALIAAAERLGAPVFYSDDLNDGQTYGAVRVVNPFL